MIENRPNDRVLAALRIAIGIFFCVFGEYKVFGAEFTLHGGFQDGLRGFLTSGSASPFIRPMLALILARCATLVAFLVGYGELAIGLSLVAGVLSRLASIFWFVLMCYFGCAAATQENILPFGATGRRQKTGLSLLSAFACSSSVRRREFGRYVA